MQGVTEGEAATKTAKLRRAIYGSLVGADDPAWVEWEERKLERLLAA